jgi:hypothetical protein
MATVNVSRIAAALNLSEQRVQQLVKEGTSCSLTEKADKRSSEGAERRKEFTRAKVEALKPCIFCGKPADSKEDLFPRWILNGGKAAA